MGGTMETLIPTGPSPDRSQFFEVRVGWRLFFFVMGLGFLAIAAGCLWGTWYASKPPPVLMGITGALFFAVFGAGTIFLACRSWRLWLFEDGRILYEDWNKVRALHAGRLLGYRLRANNGIVALLAWDDLTKRAVLQLSISTYERRDEALLWFVTRLKNLDQIDAEQDAERVRQAASDMPDSELQSLLTWFHWLRRLGLASIFVVIATLWAPAFGLSRYLPVGPVVQLTLILVVVSFVSLLRHRHMVTLDESSSPWRPNVVLILWGPLLALSMAGFCSPVVDSHGVAFFLPGLLVALVVGALPGAPEIKLRHRVLPFLLLLVLLSYLSSALNAGLALWPERREYEAVITELHSGRGNHVYWRVQQPSQAEAMEGSITHRIEGLCVGDPFQVELTRGAFGWRWLTGYRLPEPRTGATCQPATE